VHRKRQHRVSVDEDLAAQMAHLPGARPRFVPGTLRANMNTIHCGGYELMASDIQHSVKFRHRWPRQAVAHGTGTAGFGARVI
jgi:hypothetical protein